MPGLILKREWNVNNYTFSRELDTLISEEYYYFLRNYQKVITTKLDQSGSEITIDFVCGKIKINGRNYRFTKN